MVGLPRSGKSTFCKEFRKNNPNTVIVRADDIRLAMGARYNSHIEPMVSAIKGTMIKALIKEDYDNIIVDGTHTTENSIKNVIYALGEGCEVVCIPTSPEVCKDRALACGQNDLYHVISRMWRKLSDVLWKEFKLIHGDWGGLGYCTVTSVDLLEHHHEEIFKSIVDRLSEEVKKEKEMFERVV